MKHTSATNSSIPNYVYLGNNLTKNGIQTLCCVHMWYSLTQTHLEDSMAF